MKLGSTFIQNQEYSWMKLKFYCDLNLTANYRNSLDRAAELPISLLMKETKLNQMNRVSLIFSVVYELTLSSEFAKMTQGQQILLLRSLFSLNSLKIGAFHESVSYSIILEQ